MCEHNGGDSPQEVEEQTISGFKSGLASFACIGAFTVGIAGWANVGRTALDKLTPLTLEYSDKFTIASAAAGLVVGIMFTTELIRAENSTYDFDS